MDNLTHSLVGLSLAKTGLERLSPYATTVCLVSANIADADFISLFFGDRWTLLKHHRGLTHSIVGTVAIGLLVPLLAFAIERILVSRRKRAGRIRLRGLTIASLLAAATHPLMDWTNNYGLRPFLPWSGRWFYGDLVFIVDPYVWLVLGGIAFLLTSQGRLRIGAWSVLGAMVTTLLLLAGARRGADGAALMFARTIWLVGIALLITARVLGLQKKLTPRAAAIALGVLLIYWGGLAVAHHSAYGNAAMAANSFAVDRRESVLKLAAMPMFATPLRWQAVAETDRALYRFGVSIPSGAGPLLTEPVDRFEKPTGQAAQLAAVAERDRRAQALLEFARFPLAELDSTNCVGQTFVQFADLRYTEPGTARGNFSVNVPVDCPP